MKLVGESLVVSKDEEKLASIELAHLEGLVAVGRVAVTSPALAAMLEAGVPLAMLSRSGKLRGRLVPPAASSVDARLGQFAVLSCDALRLAAARKVVRRKIEAMHVAAGRWLSNQPDASLRSLREQLQRHAAAADGASNLDSLLGVEGAASRAYWGGFALMNASELPFGGRLSRPPGDPVNAMLSFGYALLANETTSALDLLGLDPAIGFYHVPQAGRPALALDLMEPLRHAVVDRAVLKAINLKRVNASHFESVDDGAAWKFTREGVRTFIELYEEAMLGEADGTLLEGPAPAAGAGTARPSCRDAMRRRCERLMPWFRSVAITKPAWRAWFDQTQAEAKVAA